MCSLAAVEILDARSTCDQVSARSQQGLAISYQIHKTAEGDAEPSLLLWITHGTVRFET